MSPWRWVAAVAHCGDKDTGGSSSGEYSVTWALLEATISSPRPRPTQQPVGSSAGMPQAKQKTGREHSLTHHQIGCLKSSWVNSCLTNILPTHSPAHQRDKTQLHPPVVRYQSLPPGSLHKPLRCPHPPRGIEQKQQELQPCILQHGNQSEKNRKKMRWQRTMSQMKEQDKTQEQLSEVKTGNLPQKKKKSV